MFDPLGNQIIPKDELEHGAYYRGHSRNANVARWDSVSEQFTHWRNKFGSTLVEVILHRSDELVYDVFDAYEKIEPVFPLIPFKPKTRG
jgi:hypothetical protein